MEQQEQQQICPWCLTDIIWDEEIGPEPNCPHCDNELGGYRTMSIGIDGDSDENQSDDDDKDEELSEWNDTEDDTEVDWAAEQDGYRGTTRGMLAAEGVIQRILDEQLEAPECPSCREYMLEAGEQLINEGFTSSVPKAIGIPIVPTPFRMLYYVCPTCFTTSTQLSVADREALITRLSEQE
ncbi:hypothetical protein ACX1C1_25755 [Paenibacillus sp. strain BS8-2]